MYLSMCWGLNSVKTKTIICYFHALIFVWDENTILTY